MKLTHFLISSALAIGGAAPCWAALGGDATSVAADSARMKGALRVSTGISFTVHEITTPAGTRVREYVGAHGKVFAVSWQGPFNPDLRQMFGTYYAQYEQGALNNGGNHRLLRIEQPDLVVQRSGRQRAFFGRAWLPALLPANVSPTDIE